MDCLLTNGISAWFLWVFGKEQLSVTASRGLSLMPQLKTAKPAGPQSTVPYFTCFKGCFNDIIYLPASSLRDQVLGIRSKRLEISCQLLFLPRSTNTMSQGQSSLRATDTIYMIPLNETIQPVWSLCHCYHRPLLYFSLIHNEPPPMSTLVPAWRWSCCPRVLGVWEGPALPVSTSNWHSVT